MEQTPGGTITMLGDDRWKGGATHNGTLLKLHENCFTAGYSKLTPLSDVSNPEFGFGVWYDASLRNNHVFQAMPTGGTTSPVFAGILTRQPGIANGYPTANKEIAPFQRGLLAKEGFLVYKTGTSGATLNDQHFTDIRVGMYLHCNNLNGRPRFSALATITGYTLAGVVVMLNPDDLSWTVNVSTLLAKATAVTSADVTSAINAAIAGQIATNITNAIAAGIAPGGVIDNAVDAVITAGIANGGVIDNRIDALIALIP